MEKITIEELLQSNNFYLHFTKTKNLQAIAQQRVTGRYRREF